MPFDIAENIANVRERIRRACVRSGRAEADIALLAVSKAQAPDAIRIAARAGVAGVGENYLQEAQEKMAVLADEPITWHFIGPLQSNKTAGVALAFAWVQSVDRLKIAQRLSAQRPPDLPPLNICVQVNIDDEHTKSGVTPAELPALLDAIATLPNVVLRGLMAIPRAQPSPEQSRASFARMRELFETHRALFPQFDTLSMGMSDDFEIAIEEGATLVRVGSAIFGARPAKDFLEISKAGV
ncbi:MAG TPA: YggS family pyridoxal phosphate-dependent enzyme [Spongiibacteraceae bacterium]|nr:YggS family pyridoxal phosphate-dependent enzyme [Spongiibacteraceae bacterium]